MEPVTHELVHSPHALARQEDALRAVRARRDRGGQLLGLWNAETGTQNRIVSLWAIDDPARTAGTDGRDAWMSADEVHRGLVARRAVATHLLASPLVELRRYAPHAGQCETFVSALLRALPHRERYSPCAGLWTSREGDRDIVVHLWAYPSYEARLTARAAAHRDAAWSEYRVAIRAMLGPMHATLMTPAAA